MKKTNFSNFFIEPVSNIFPGILNLSMNSTIKKITIWLNNSHNYNELYINTTWIRSFPPSFVFFFASKDDLFPLHWTQPSFLLDLPTLLQNHGSKVIWIFFFFVCFILPHGNNPPTRQSEWYSMNSRLVPLPLLPMKSTLKKLYFTDYKTCVRKKSF